MMEENPMRHYDQLSNASADSGYSGYSATSDFSDRSSELPPSFKVLKKHEYTITEELGRGISGRAFLVKSPDEDFLVVKEINYRDMHHYRKLSNASEDSCYRADSDSSDNSIGLPPLFKVLKKHEYTITEELGRGISGRAFLVKSPDEDFLVVKEINYRDFDLDAAKNEINILKNLHHGYIVAYEDSFEDEESGYFYIVLEYCAGRDLYKKMRMQEGFFEEEQILDWLVQICLALQYLNENNVLHRDIKPQNVFLTEDGYINLGDFGCAKVLQRADESVVGAELYASPEIYENRHNSKSDIWSLGWLLHDLCMLDVWSNIIERRFLHASSLRGTKPTISNRYSEDLRGLICQMLSRDPHMRPSAGEILAKPFLNDAVQRNKIPDALQRSYLTSSNDFNEAYDKHYNDFEIVVSEWKTTTDSLEEIHRNCTIGSLSGAVIGAAGGITAVVGAILSPFTFGASLIVTGVGIGVGVAGSVTGAASNITNTVKQEELREKFEKNQQDYKKASEPILKSLKTLRKVMRKLTRFRDFVRSSTVDNVQMSWRIGRITVGGTEFVTLGMLASFDSIAVEVFNVGTAVAAASGVLSGILVIADVAFIVKDAREIHRMRQGRVDDPENVESSVLKAIAQMRKTHTELCEALRVIQETKN